MKSTVFLLMGVLFLLLILSGCSSDGKNDVAVGDGGDIIIDTDTSEDSQNDVDSTDVDSSSNEDSAGDDDTGSELNTDTGDVDPDGGDTDVPYQDTETVPEKDTNACESDLDCDPSMFCDTVQKQCVPDVCDPGETICQEDDVMECLPSGSGWSVRVTCDSASYYESVCSEISVDLSGCGCEDDWDCPAHTVCEEDVCTGTGVEPTCSLPPEPFEDVLPTIEIEWGGKSLKKPEAVGSPFPSSSQTVMSPLVINLNDDNGDGKIGERDFPEIVFATFCDSQFTSNGVLRAIHGGGPDKGKDYFAVCGDKVWREGDSLDMTCDCEKADLNSTASLAAGDLDNDGVPEIVAMLEGSDGGLAIYSHTGDIISKSAGLKMGYNNPGITLANIDNQGLVEIIVGRYVYTLQHDADGKLQILDTFSGDLAHGKQGQGPVTCVANLKGDSRQEIVAATTVYGLPRPPPGVTKRAECQGNYNDAEHKAFCQGKLLVIWDGLTENPKIIREGFCAVADVLGANQDAAPGPDNPLDGLPEVITVSEGHLQILNGQNGKISRDIDLEAGSKGGPPNVDDFDGDGFPEVGSAFAAAYIMIDLQDPTEDCPQWPTAFDDEKDGLQGNPERKGPCLHNGWRRVTEDNSSRVTGSSVFDFNGDGTAEVVYNDECYFRVYDGTTGAVLFKENSPSRTRIEYPVVADVDNDGNAEIVFGTSNESGFCSEGNDFNNGLEVWGDENDLWVSARRIWNQHAYHITNVLESGGIPEFEPESWVPYNDRIYNTYRSNPRSYGVAPDLTVTALQMSSPDATCGQLSSLLDIAVRVENKGDLRIGPGVEVSFYGEWTSPSLKEALKDEDKLTPLKAVISASLEPGESVILTVHYNAANNAPGALPGYVNVIVDEEDKERECKEGNNGLRGKVDPGVSLPDLAIVLGVVDVGTCPKPTVETTVTNVGSAPASDILVRYYAGDPSQGGLQIHEKLIPGPLEGGGGSITFAEPLENFPEEVAIRIWAIVDPLDTVQECNDGNNRDMVDDKTVCEGTVI